MNMQSLMAQAQKLQRDMNKKKEEINNSTFEGVSEWVTAVINGKKEIVSIKITYTEPIDEDDKEILEDMLKIAINKANALVDKEIESKMGAYSSAFNGMI